MSKLTKQMAKVLSFAHLTGVAGKRAEEDEKDRREEAEDEDPDKKEQDREDSTSKKGKRAEDDEDKDKAEDDDLDEDKEKDGAKGSKADDQDAEDDDDEDEMRGKSAAASARRRERARCAAIFGSKAAGRNPVLAANLAFNTNMTRKEALAVLESTPASMGVAEFASGRSARNPGIGAGGGQASTSKQNTDARWDRAFQKANSRR
ncbi:hypothetical protein EJD96_15945 [Herbaspirillum seropedicae]|uniref:hypothetical protein n=1 Tax=Herbaspirillum seropedicae TaxID=964 RepID=UPI001121621E|nr:hypothetical protein [Herbaspirillum seropedicae]QDD65542.1 hypothetical protein EJD96_15945 [Herbaspirillum seropedicae]